MTKLDPTPPMSMAQKLLLQQVTGKFLYYARGIDDTMMHSLNDLATQTNDGTQMTAAAITHFLNYCASNPDAVTLYRASDMILTIHSDAAYLVAPKARSRAGGFVFLGNKDGSLINGSISVLAKVMKMVLASAAEAEIGALYMNARNAVPLRTTLAELGHPQPPTPLCTDNSTANGIMNSTIKQNRSKAIDMRFYWLRDRVNQGQFHVYWAPGAINLGDYPTKHHSGSHHRQVRPIYVYDPNKSPTDMQGCIKLLARPSSARPSKGAPRAPAAPTVNSNTSVGRANSTVTTSTTTVATGIAYLTRIARATSRLLATTRIIQNTHTATVMPYAYP